jgi:large subunit ribosomal protein L21
MFAVLKTGGKQYRVKSGDMLRVEKLAADAGEKVQFNEVLMLGGDDMVVGAPLIEDAGVQAEVVDQIKGDKLIHYVKRRRKHSSQRRKGHRQQLTLLRVTDILAKGAGKSGVKEAIGAGSVSGAAAPKADKATPGKTDGAAVKTTNKSEAATLDAQANNDSDAAQDLTAITGIGPAAQKKLNEAGVFTYAQLAAIDADSFDAVKVKPEWIEQAKELA